MRTQWSRGNQNVQIQDVSASSIRIVFDGQPPREVPLEPAVVPVGKRASPARLVRARSGVVPYAARAGLLRELEDWARLPEAFSGCVIGGRGGSGKTRLGVELCDRGRGAEWLCGMLSRSADAAALDTLVQTPTARLVVIDYAESRVEQLEAILPLLAARATVEHPVRVLLLTRAGPRRGTDWTEALRHHSDALDAVLDDLDVRVLDEAPLEPSEREALFSAAAAAFAERAEPPGRAVPPPATLGAPVFASPLLVVIAAYLSLHTEAAVPATRTELLDELLAHEDRYWRASAKQLDTDDTLRRRVVALATLAGAASEAEAVELLTLVPDLEDASGERLRRVARWAHSLYPGPKWWNPLEPDLAGEHLVAQCYTNQPRVLVGVLDRRSPSGMTQPLGLYARAAADHPQFAAAVRQVLTDGLEQLCSVAVAEAASETDLKLLLGDVTVAAALDQVVTVIPVGPNLLLRAVELLPPRPDVILSSLALTLTMQLVAHVRRVAAANPAAYEPDLATSLNNLSNRLAEVGRREEGLAAIEEAVAVRRRLAGANPAAYEPDLAGSLNNLSNRLAEVGRREEGLAAIEEAVAVRRRLAGANPAAYEPDLASSLNNLSLRLGEVGRRREEGLAAIEEAVALYRRLAGANPAAYEPDLATSLNNLSVDLCEVGRREEGLTAIEEAVVVYRRLAAANPAAYEPVLATSLNILEALRQT